MEKQFLEKLKNLEVSPSARADQLFESKLKIVRKKPTYFRWAASIALLLGLFLAWQWISTKSTHQVQPAVAANLKASKDLTITAVIPKLESNLAEVIKDKPEFSPKFTNTKKADYNQINLPVGVEHLESENPSKRLLTSTPKINGSEDYLLQEISYSPVNLSFTPSEKYVESVEPAGLQSSSLFTKTIEEMKYVANGEKLDLDRAGIKPKVMTMVYQEDRLISHEIRQVRNGIERFKQILK